MAAKGVTLLGAGTQGRRLAYMWSRHGRPVYLVDREERQLHAALASVNSLRMERQSMKDFNEDGEVSAVSADKLSDVLRKSWLFIECVPERLSLKKDVIKQVDGIADKDTIIASNSSSFSITDILQGESMEHSGRCVSMHSYWPPETPALEIMGSEQTKSDIISLLMEESKRHGFDPYHVKRPSKGYIYNRIWAAIKRETLLELSEGTAEPAEIDAIYKSVLKTPKGPCEQMDTVGLDVVLDIEQSYAEVRKDLPEEPRALLRSYIDQGKLGVKSGRGFYEYDERGVRKH